MLLKCVVDRLCACILWDTLHLFAIYSPLLTYHVSLPLLDYIRHGRLASIIPPHSGTECAESADLVLFLQEQCDRGVKHPYTQETPQRGAQRGT